MKKIRVKPVKLIELLKTLDRKEFNGFGRYVNSMVKDKNVYKLFLELKKYAPTFEVPQKKREKIFEKIFGKVKYDNRQLNYLTSAMNLHLEEYLIMIAIRQDQRQKDYMLMEYYKSRNQYDFFKRTADSIMERENEKMVKDGEYYLTKMKINYDLYYYIDTDNKRIKRQSARIKTMVDSLDEFYMYYKLNLASDLTAFGKTFNVGKDINLFLEEIKTIIVKYPIHENILIQIYIFIIDNFEKHSYENYILLRNKILSVIDDLSDEHQQALFSCLSNYAISCQRSRIAGFRHYTFELLKMGIDKKYNIKNGELSYQSFINTILIATAQDINEIKWAKEVIKEKGHLVTKKVREDSLSLANAYVDFAEQNYGDALQKLNLIQNWRQHSFSVQGRFLTLKCYYELDIETDGQYLDSAEYFVDSYRNFLKRNKIFSDSINRAIINLITFTIKVMRNRYSKRYTEDELLKQIKKYQPMAGQHWAIEIVNTHLKRKKKIA